MLVIVVVVFISFLVSRTGMAPMMYLNWRLFLIEIPMKCLLSIGIHGGMKCFAMSVITDLGVPGKQVRVTHEDVINVANAAEPKMSGIVKELIARM